jgi:O-antigen ligase
MTNRYQILTIAGLVTAVFALLIMGALHTRQQVLTRGLPDGLPPPIPQAGIQPGLNVNLAAYDDYQLDENLAQIKSLGVDYVKHSFYYHENFDWVESDRLLTAVARHNLTLIPLLDGSPHNNFAPVPPADFARWAGVFAQRYSGQIPAYIIWDEPNINSHWGGQPVNAAEYAALLSAAAAAIRAADGEALISAAPLAPTIETGPQNLADPLYLQRLYEADAAHAFDIVMAKPYGFAYPPDDRRVDLNVTNFSRAILLREVMERNNDGHKPIWAGNWGWNALPEGWRGPPSIWGETTPQQQAAWSAAALERARQEWPWMGLMFLENWQPGSDEADPRWGFSIAGRETAAALQQTLDQWDAAVAYPGFHLARPDDPAQQFRGNWRFSPEFGADISQSEPPDSVTFTFWGTDVGLRVRRADFRARLYITIDGHPANALPQDEQGSTLILTSADPHEDTISLEWVARGLEPGVHTMTIVADRGWDQWALNGFSVVYRPPDASYRWGMVGLGLTAVLALLLAFSSTRQADWGTWGARLERAYGRLSDHTQLLLTALAGAIVALTGWLTWGSEAAGLYRRLGDAGQLALTAVTASIFYVAPSFYVYALALVALLLLIRLRPAWGLVLIAFCFPFYVPDVTKPIFSYRFSPVEVFTLVTLAAYLLKAIPEWASRYSVVSSQYSANSEEYALRTTHYALRRPNLHTADYAALAFLLVATLSLFFTERLGVALTEWRVVIVEPLIFYFLLRAIRPSGREMWRLLDGFVLGGLLVAGLGLWQYGTGHEALITAEAGLMRLRSIYGSPNNVALYLGRILPLLLAVVWLGGPLHGRRRWLYGGMALPIGLAILLSFSRGGLLLAVPAGFLVIFWVWQRGLSLREQDNGHSPWPWLILFAIAGAIGLLIAQRIPALAGRLDLASATSFFRLNLWRASLNMIADNALTGVGLDNFLYAYRSRYIFDAAWQEPNLNHPHNIVLDFATRLGLLGLLAGGWLFWSLGRTLRRAHSHVSAEWQPVAVGLAGALAAILAHGLVDHSFFLIDLAYTFYLLLGTAVWLQNQYGGSTGPS